MSTHFKIAILGAGSVGSTLGELWARKGHTVVFGVPDPAGQKMKVPSIFRPNALKPKTPTQTKLA